MRPEVSINKNSFCSWKIRFDSSVVRNADDQTFRRKVGTGALTGVKKVSSVVQHDGESTNSYFKPKIPAQSNPRYTIPSLEFILKLARGA